jgi:hypothetical protein
MEENLSSTELRVREIIFVHLKMDNFGQLSFTLIIFLFPPLLFIFFLQEKKEDYFKLSTFGYTMT